jgi:quinone-modifying oxidoreductase, subunit QmoC
MQHYRVDPALAEDLAAFGGNTLGRCFSCGNCTAVCGLSKGDTVFPRKIIRYLQVGLSDRLLESPEPWLCYYCGTCSDTCPRSAEPGELMMATRRWLVSRYDWTGLSRRLYLSEAWEFGLLAGIAAFVLALFLVPGWLGMPFGFAAIGAAATEHVRLDLFAPNPAVHAGDLVLAALLVLLLGINAFRMASFVARGRAGLKVPLSIWLGKAYDFVVHAATQKRWLQCDNDARGPWLRHFLLVTGYATMLLLVVAFLPVFQRDDARFHWTALPGYYGTAVLLGVTALAIRSRLQKKVQYHRFSHASDWTFLVLLFLTALSGIVLHAARLFDLPWPTYVLYVVHLMIAVPMLIIEVPFGKWNHLLFRPLAQYLVVVREAAMARQPAPTVHARHAPATAR